jgi:hypothetical protein
VKAAQLIHQTNVAYKHVFASPEGKTVLDDLMTAFGGNTLKKNMGTVDEAGTLAASGAREVLIHIQQRIKHAVD